MKRNNSNLFRILNNTGSTLLMVIITVALLSILGTTLLGMTTMNVGMKYTDKVFKATHYYAESGIEEAYAKTGKAVEKDLKIAKEKTNEYMNKMVSELDVAINILKSKYVNEQGKIDLKLLEKDEEAIKPNQYYNLDKDLLENTVVRELSLKKFQETYIDEDFNIKVKEIQSLLDSYFNEKFYKAWNDGILELTKEIEGKAYSFKDEGTPEIKAITSFKELDKDVDTSELSIISKFVRKETQQNIGATIVVSNPKLKFPIKIGEKLMIDSPIWHYGLVAGGDIFMNGSDIQINGDVYAYGSVAEDMINLDDFKGIVVNGKGNAKITGDVLTHSFIQTRGENSSLTITDSNIFTNTLTIHKDAENSTIKLTNSTLHTKDDIELNGKNSTISLEGAYIGFSDGGNYIYNNAKEEVPVHDRSSAIIINSVDIGKGSNLIINPTPGKLPTQAGLAGVQAGQDLFQNSQILIPGTSWILGNEYQTGESVSMKGNYLAYSVLMDDVGEDKKPSIYDQTRVYKPRKEIILNNDVQNPISLELSDGYSEGGSFKSYNQRQRDKYFQKVYDKYKDNDKIFPNLTGINGVKINKDSYWYVLGSNIADNKISQGRGEEEAAAIKVKLVLEDVNRDYQYIMSRLLYRQSQEQGIITNEKEDVSKEEQAIKYYLSDSFKDFKGEIDTNPTLKQNDSGAIPILYAGENYTLQGQPGEVYEGIIVAKKDITISGDIEFRGTLIAGKDIIIEGTPILTNNGNAQWRIIELVDSNPAFKKLLNEEATRPVKQVFKVEAGILDNMGYQYKQLVNIVDWKQEKVEENP